uniref:Tafazzin family protein n=1 Tax=Palpitomonas bilix TaxID=652834 RepID=A0A7S3D506_9EUKA|mmetsp:Transcript_21877/g.56814  ORF Transcript_21877/g.56814 Transcript_21877/m.56814 type:complete len:294 (+) Transcript_21877:177-1058(+)
MQDQLGSFFVSVRSLLRPAPPVFVPAPFENVSDAEGEDEILGDSYQSGSSSFVAPPVASAPISIEEEDLPVLSSSLRTLLVGVIALFSKSVMNGLNTTEVLHEERIQDIIYHRPDNRGLVTVSNHTSAVDDPFTPSVFLPTPWLLDSDLVRWTLCATDRCFKNQAMSFFFKTVKVLPVQRGAGLDHHYMQTAVDMVSRGHWMHIFPEGTRSKTGELGKMKIGVGKLVAGAEVTPLVVPFVHQGMEKIMRRGTFLPSTGKKASDVGARLRPLPLTFRREGHHQHRRAHRFSRSD